MSNKKKDRYGLYLNYSNPDSLMSKKIKYIDSNIKKSDLFLDIGIGTGELIDLEKYKFKEIYGIDIDDEFINNCNNRFEEYQYIKILKKDIRNLNIDKKFDYISVCDIIEHISLNDSIKVLKKINNLLVNDGILIFTGPGIFEKFKIYLGKSHEHKHSHSSYGWSKIIKKSGFKIIKIESIEFPIIDIEYLRKHFHLLGKCCLIIAQKK